MNKMNVRLINHLPSIFLLVCLLFHSLLSAQWEKDLHVTLSEFGHRNWIVIADYAYPKQSAPGIETIYTGEDQLEVVEKVLRQVENAPHIQAIVLFDSEMMFVPENEAPGIETYKKDLKNLLKGKDVKSMPHEEIIAKLDESSKLFNVLILKTNMTIPYTSVFLELDCGYWGPEQEKAMREKMKDKN